MKIIQKKIRKEKGKPLYRAVLKYENGDGSKRTYSILETSRGRALNFINFKLGAITRCQTSVDVSSILTRKQKI